MAYEIEIKLQIKDTAEQAKLREFLCSNKLMKAEGSINMLAIYFDTPDRAFGKNKMAYRIRRENASLAATLKGGGGAAGGLHKRLECNVEVQSENPDLTVFKSTEGETIINQLPNGGVGLELSELVRTEFEREIYLWTSEDTVVEAALDTGWIYAGAKKSPILELELELKAGSEQVLQALADEFCKHFYLVPADKSKLLRGLELLK